LMSAPPRYERQRYAADASAPADAAAPAAFDIRC